MNSPLFSIVITTYNRPEEFLLRAVGSALEQTEDSKEVIVVDDNSGQPLPTLPLGNRVSLVKRDVNSGSAAARNTGIDAASGRFITFLDDDDWLHPERLSSVRRRLDEAPVVICWSEFDDGQPAPPRRYLEGMVHDTILDDYTPHVGATVVHRDHILSFDETYRASQDIEWWLRVSRRRSVATVPASRYVIRRHSGPRYRSGLKQRIEAAERMLKHHSGYFDTHDRAAGFRLWRIGSMSMTIGDYEKARSSLARSLILRPRMGTAKRTLKALALSIAHR